ncbi:predicted protein [Uncinocarpus reesii 1704]|uniref:EngB-type G domain-containing protein n=1 Tax=Uncinocarpus reesii (strain UAMH 1704) TaxID=336963 RepID=C4JSG5_UNCRE|nr:uncharacterized protein UREG_05404 [Uncinocarpus reesii 1704]EEP80562.1 predicted protein [Uncinocarpus reesii 1704]
MRSPFSRALRRPHNCLFIRLLPRHYATETPVNPGKPAIQSGQTSSPVKERDTEFSLPEGFTEENPCLYHDTLPPQPSQLAYAKHFFTRSKHSPVYLWGTDIFRTIPEAAIPEVVFIGRSNVGKSSIINALVGEDICASSKKLGRTKLISAIGLGGTKNEDSRIALVDTPGYGKGSQAEWGQEIQKYLEKRKQLRRIFLLLDGKVGLKPRDHDVLAFLRQFAVPYQLVLTKSDHTLGIDNRKKGCEPKASQSGLFRLSQTAQNILSAARPLNPSMEGPGPLGDVIACSVQMERKKRRRITTGINALQWAILLATGFDQIPRGFKNKS